MDPKLRALLIQLAGRMQTTNSQVATELQAYLASDGHTPLTTGTLAMVEPIVRQQGLTLLNAPGAVTPGNNGNIGPGAAAAIQHDQNGNPVAYVPPSTSPIPGASPGPGANGQGVGGTSPYTPPAPRLSPLPGDENNTPSPMGQPIPGQATPPPLPTGPGVLSGPPGVSPGAANNDGNPGGYSTAFGDTLEGNDDVLLRFALKAAGFNPDIVTPASKIAAQKLGQLVQARRAAYGAAGDGSQNAGGLPQDIASFAKEYTTPGANFYGNARQYAQGIVGSQGLQDNLGGVSDQSDKFGMYQALIPLLYGGSNPLIQQSVADQFKNLYGNWEYDDAQDPNKNADILQYIRSRPNLSPALASIFGKLK